MTPQELAELDLAVAKIEGVDAYVAAETDEVWCGNRMYQPTRDWSLAGPLLEKYKLTVAWHEDGERWEAWKQHWEPLKDRDGRLEWNSAPGLGETPCIAICQAIVALKS